jgi:hypothetical protein
MTDNSISCQKTPTTTGDYMYLELKTNYLSTCTTSACYTFYDSIVKKKFKTTNLEFPMNVTLTNGTSIAITVSFCSFDTYVTTTTTNTTTTNSTATNTTGLQKSFCPKNFTLILSRTMFQSAVDINGSYIQCMLFS